MLTKTVKLKQSDINKNKTKAFEEGVIEWVKFFRANPHRFITCYLNLPLYTFQMIIIFMFDKFNYNMLTCSRGAGKSYITAVYSCCRAILYPHSKIIIGASTKSQAKLIITQKIEKELMSKSSNLKREIKSIQCNNNEAKVLFYNGSTIEAVVSGENSRGYRCNILIIDEFRLVSKEIQDRIMRPFLNVNRQPAFTLKKEYENYPIEENKEIYLSSCYFKECEAYYKFKHYVKQMAKGNDYFVLNTSYKLAMHHGLLSQARADSMRKEMDSVSWAMEMESLWWGENENAFFKSSEVNPCRTLKNPFYPPSSVEYLMNKDKRKKNNYAKKPGEIRIIGADIALSAGSKNDNSVFTCMRLIPVNDEFIRQVVHIESYNAMNSEKQAIRLKQLFEDFDADKIIIDSQALGQTVFQELHKNNFDDERNIEYDRWTCFNEDNTIDKTMYRGALPVIYSMKAYQQINHDIAMGLKDVFIKGKIQLPISDIEVKDILVEKFDFTSKSPLEQAKLLLPYAQTTSLVSELVNLEFTLSSGKVKISEKSGCRKDRYSSLAYTNYLADIIEKEEYKKRSNDTGSDFLFLN